MNSDKINEILDKHLLSNETSFDWSKYDFDQIKIIQYLANAIFKANDTSDDSSLIKLLTLFSSYLKSLSPKENENESDIINLWNNIIKPQLVPRDDYMVQNQLDFEIKEVDKALIPTKAEENSFPPNERPSMYISLKRIYESMINPDYFDEKEVDGNNWIYRYINSEKIIQYCSLHLFIKKICLENFYTEYPILITGFIQQCPAFLDLEMFIQKIRKAFFLYHENERLPHDNIILFLNDLILTRYDEISTPNNLKILWDFYVQLIIIYKDNKMFIDKHLKPIVSIVNEKSDTYQTNYIKYSQKKKERTLTIIMKKIIPLKTPPMTYFDYHCWQSENVALQLTYYSREIMMDININEIICARYAKNNKHITSPNVLKLIDRFDKLINFIVEEVLSYDYPEERANVMTYWIDVAKECKAINNFNDLMAICTAFRNPIIICLKETWKKMGMNMMKEIKALNKFCSIDSSYANFRGEIDKCIQKNVAYLPYLGILLKEISYYEENVPSLKNNCLISFHKIKKVTVSIETFFHFEKIPLNFRPIPELGIFNILNPKTYELLEEIGDKLGKNNISLKIYRT